MKPPLGSALAKFPEGFDPDMTYQLRERDPPTLKEMKKVAISVEANLAEIKARIRSEKKVTYRDEVMPSVSSSDPKIDNLVRSMEKMWERINLNEKVPLKGNQPNPQNRNRNQNFRRDLPQNKPRENDQQIRLPFNENYVDEVERDMEPLDENHLNLIGSDSEGEVFLT